MVRLDYGQTYGNSSKSTFQENRMKALNSSLRYPQTDAAKTVIDTKPRFVKASQEGNLWMSTPLPYTLHLNGFRRDEILQFDKSAQLHREHYKDHSGLATPVRKLQRASSAPPIMIRAQHRLPVSIYSSSSPTVSYIRQTSNSKAYPQFQRRGSVLERTTRNSFFQKR
jgi:hypothetical protein